MSGHIGATERDATLELTRRGVAALQAQDWTTLRSLYAEDVTWRVPGRGPWAGTLHGIDAVVERWQQAAAAAAGQLAEVVAVMASEDMAVVVQRPPIAASGDDVLTMLTLCTFRDGVVVRVQTYYSDQYTVDGLSASWTTAPSPGQ